MTDKTKHASDDRTTNRGTVKGHHPKPGDNVTEGGIAPAPTEGHGAPKGAASKAVAEGAVAGDDTSSATVGKQEKQHAEQVNAGKPQSGHRHDH